MSKKSKEVFDAARKREQEISDAVFEAPIEQQAGFKRERPKDLEVVSSGASYHDFIKEPIFEGNFVSKFLAPKDIPSNKTKKGDVIGFNMVDAITGKESIISNSYAIQKALEESGFSKDITWWIEFEGKFQVKGKPFNRFYIAKLKK